MADCVFVTATLILTLSFIATGIGFFAPFWVTVDRALSPVADQGLWGACSAGECTWFWSNDFAWGKQLDGNISLGYYQIVYSLYTFFLR